jgi:hypothetical protein
MGRPAARRLVVILAGLSLITACSLSGPTPTSTPSVDPSQTMQAALTEAAGTLAAAPTNTALPTDTPQPTSTPVPSATASVTLSPTFTSSPTIPAPVAIVSVNTNCRSGPATSFRQLYIALAGSTQQVVARTTLDDYVLVEIPNKPGQTCWLWTNYVQLVGNLSGLPVATPPPTPTPTYTPTPTVDFSLSYDSLESCAGWDPGFKVVNEGDLTFESVRVSADDKDTNVSVLSYADLFDQRNGCAVAKEISDLKPGQTGYVYASSFNDDPTGHSMTAKVTLCTDQDMAGQCVTLKIDFTP